MKTAMLMTFIFLVLLLLSFLIVSLLNTLRKAEFEEAATALWKKEPPPDKRD